MSIIDEALGYGDQRQALLRAFTVLRQGLPPDEMKVVVEGMRDDRDRETATTRAAAQKLLDAGANEGLVVAFMDAVTDLATHDTLFRLLSAAMLTDTHPAANPLPVDSAKVNNNQPTN